jgi:predicted membrane-bound dolichyl-phosphate-mannose-protein mannosyltransferase
MARRLQALASGRPSLPLLALAVVCVISLAARGAWLGQPCHSPCRTPADRVLIFDERYYVNAARVIAGIYPPLGSPYANTPLGVDPNSEHPQLAKLVIAGSIELFGDGPLAWRLGSLVAGTLAILGMFALVRAAGGGRWTALAGAALMAADNLMIVHGRIGTLDVYALAAMVWAAALYLRGRPLLAGVVIAVGLCTKLVVAYVLLVLALVELLQWLGSRERPLARVRRLAGCSAIAVAGFVALLAALDQLAAPYDDATRKLVSGGPFGHLGHMIRYAAQQTSPHGPQGIASYPWGWLVDYKPITYLNVNPASPSTGLFGVHPAVHFLGLISPPILLVALPALAFAARTARPRRSGPDRDLVVLAVAWFAGTFLPFVMLSLLWKRTSYLYYMVIVMPGLYAAAAWLLTKTRRWPRVKALWVVSVLAAAVVAYPFTPLP